MNKIYDICIIGGCGHVGLPLAISLADHGKNTCIYDINADAIETIKNGTIPFWEENAQPVLKKVLGNGTLELSNNPNVISESDNAVVIVGTPVDEHLNPEFGLIMNLMEELSDFFYDGQLIILRSTVYPGISKKVHDWLHERGKKVHIAFCPERILEGKAMEELEKLPQIVSSFSQEGLTRSKEIFGVLTNDLVELQPMEAELAKLFSNVWRYIKFATANQFYMLANDYGLDFYNIYYGMTHNYDRCSDLPKPGFAAGPCLFKDTMQLGAFSNNAFQLGHTAMLINEGLPNYVVKKIKDKYDISKMTIGILGMAFKGNSDDIRESLSYKLKKILQIEAKEVLCTDPYVDDNRLVDLQDVLRKSDIIIIATPHADYKGLKIEGKKYIADIWNVLGNGGVI